MIETKKVSLGNLFSMFLTNYLLITMFLNFNEDNKNIHSIVDELFWNISILQYLIALIIILNVKYLLVLQN